MLENGEKIMKFLSCVTAAAVFGLMLSGPAFAGPGHANSGPSADANSKSTAVSTTASTSTASSNNADSNKQAQGQSVTEENTSINKDPLQAPGTIVQSSNTTAPCVVAMGGGVSFPGGSVGLTGGVQDKGCELRNRVDLLKDLGHKDVAQVLLCNADLAVRQAFVDAGQSCYPGKDTLQPSAAATSTSTNQSAVGANDGKKPVMGDSVPQPHALAAADKSGTEQLALRGEQKP
jgi:hypothetical protein